MWLKKELLLVSASLSRLSLLEEWKNQHHTSPTIYIGEYDEKWWWNNKNNNSARGYHLSNNYYEKISCEIV